MARLGIGYDQVAAAAVELLQAGHTVTVDNVRTQLGGTGSKSTIAPLLKRWRAKSTMAAAVGTGLPDDLIQAVHRLYDDVHQRFKTDAAAAEIAANLRIDALSAENQRLLAQLAERDQAYGQLDNALARSQTRGADLEDALRDAHMALQQREAAQEILEQRLTERTSEVAHLREQIALAHRQFDHFQTASQRRFDDERKLSEAKLSQALRAHEQVRQDLNQAERQVAANNAQLEQVTLDREQLRSTQLQLQSQFDELREENATHAEAARRLNLDIAQHVASLSALEHSHKQTATQLSETQLQLAVSISKREMLEASLAASEQRCEIARRETELHLRREAELESALRRCESRATSNP